MGAYIETKGWGVPQDRLDRLRSIWGTYNANEVVRNVQGMMRTSDYRGKYMLEPQGMTVGAGTVGLLRPMWWLGTPRITSSLVMWEYGKDWDVRADSWDDNTTNTCHGFTLGLVEAPGRAGIGRFHAQFVVWGEEALGTVDDINGYAQLLERVTEYIRNARIKADKWTLFK
ncbi:MAG TPA: hypothetical protein VJB96_04150 [Patescibacteria group bacterium]|nr:hypothetical protein [Patescibacteria group bacterium]